MILTTSPITNKLVDWFDRTWLGFFSLKVVLMIIAERFFHNGAILGYALFIGIFLSLCTILENSIFSKKRIYKFIYIGAISIFFIKIVNTNRIDYNNEENVLKEYVLLLEEKQNFSYRIIESIPKCSNLIGNIAHSDYYLKNENKFIKVSCKLVMRGSKIILKNVRSQKVKDSLWFTIRKGIINQFPNTPTGNLSCAIIMGNREFVDKPLVRSYRDAGVLHLFAVSGLHIGFMYILVKLICSMLFFKKFICEFIAVFFAGIYVVIVGFPESATRAWLMLFIFLMVTFFVRSNNPMNSLLLSGLIILFEDHESLFSVGFQMSYTIVFGIIWVLKMDKKRIIDKTIYHNVLSIFKITVTCSFASCFLIIDHFNFFSGVSFLTNFFIQPFVFIFFTISFCTIFIEIDFLNSFAEYIHVYINYVCDFFSYINSYFFYNFELNLHNSIHLIIFSLFIFSYNLSLHSRLRFFLVGIFYILTFFTFAIIPIFK